MADPEPLTQEGKRLKIDTVLNGKDTDDKKTQTDPLLLLSIEGTEEFSKPFSYGVKLWRSVLKKPFLDADALMKLVNTPVTVTITLHEFQEVGTFFEPGKVGQDISHGDDKVIRIERSGVFEDVKDEGFIHNEEGAAPNLVFQYSATIVPAFKMMNYETVFRVFENKTVIEIITDITKTNKFPFLDVEFDPSINQLTFPKMPYCVQYQETTYNFLSRLMNRFGIWYYFNHNRNLQGAPPHKSTMIIGAEFPTFPSCRNTITSGKNLGELVALDKLVTTLREPSPTTIRDFGGMFHPAASRFQKAGDFNPLDPRSPYGGNATISSSRDLLKHDTTQPDVDRYRKEEFHVPSSGNTESKDYAGHQMEAAEQLVATFHGSTRNPAFMPGFTFDLVGDERVGDRNVVGPDLQEISGKSDVITFAGGAVSGGEGGDSQNNLLFESSGKPSPHLLTFVKFGGTVVEYINDLGFLDKLKAGLFPKDTSALDAMANFTNAGLNNYLQNQLPLNLGQPVGGPLPYFLPFVFGGGLAGVAALIPLMVKLLQAEKPESEFHCSFSAVSLPTPPSGTQSSAVPPPTKTCAPLPTDWVKTFARGPHLAVVIGKDGVDTKQGEIYADKLGRIRVRFPWDRRPNDKSAGSQFLRGDDTCWVRVSEGWAGRRFGIQFLPRIGQEVIVDFLDGDPDRPIVIGRVYNADLGEVNLTFPSGGERPQFSQDDLLNETPDSGSSDFRFNGIRTSSVPTFEPGQSNKRLEERFHLLRFDDTRGAEQYLMRSQGRMDVTVMGTYYNSTHGSYNLTVGGQDPKTLKCGGDLTTKVFKNYDLTVGKDDDADPPGSMRTTVSQNYELTVGTAPTFGNTFFDLKKDWVVNVGGGFTVNALATAGPPPINGSIVLNAMNDITLMVGPNMIVLNTAGIFMVAPSINLAGPVFGLLPLMAVPPNPPPPTGVGIPLVLVKVPVKTPTDADPGTSLKPPPTS
jgi:uncharacterized protein involved in type VI secretion and phage assembly